MPIYVLLVGGYLSLFTAGLTLKYFTGWDSGVCMTLIVIAIPTLGAVGWALIKIGKSILTTAVFLGFIISRVMKYQL